jgi:peptidoglycan hydrolase-like protein with peptidoglycan-binding domain
MSSAEYTEVTDSYGELRLYSSGEWVSYAQQLLATHGFGPDQSDGYFTEHTEQLVRDFQAASGLTADGIVGAATWAALQGTPSPAGPAGGAWSPSSGPNLEFASGPSVSGIGMEWTVRNVGGAPVAAFTELGDYEVWDRGDITVTVAKSQTFTTLNEIGPGAVEPFFIDLESIVPTDGQYKAVVEMGSEIKELDFDVRGLRVQAVRP